MSVRCQLIVQLTSFFCFDVQDVILVKEIRKLHSHVGTQGEGEELPFLRLHDGI